MDINSLAHTTWECKYHLVFAPEYQRADFINIWLWTNISQEDTCMANVCL
jgi:REP element-mobilizing transposase RayT